MAKVKHTFGAHTAKLSAHDAKINSLQDELARVEAERCDDKARHAAEIKLLRTEIERVQAQERENRGIAFQPVKPSIPGPERNAKGEIIVDPNLPSYADRQYARLVKRFPTDAELAEKLKDLEADKESMESELEKIETVSERCQVKLQKAKESLTKAQARYSTKLTEMDRVKRKLNQNKERLRNTEQAMNRIEYELNHDPNRNANRLQREAIEKARAGRRKDIEDAGFVNYGGRDETRHMDDYDPMDVTHD